jgi:hypothetical protein
MFRRRRAARSGVPATGTGKPLFGGPWGRRHPNPYEGAGTTTTYGGNVAVPPPAYSRDGVYTTNPPV